ncbi:hypothetical protein ACFSTE_10945 [Aquimarina hainanensis]|uniref:Lipocalin-like domain-containing protein n=1 Tax=Aquimarina hainanensis TaxID=1578017 RepID=A0ABW5N8J4_9FLAO
MKFFKVIIVLFLVLSCSNNETSFDNSLLVGNWSSLRKGNYQEYYFDGETMYLYDLNTDNIVKYKYTIKGDSIYRSFIHPDLKNSESKYFSRVVKFDDDQLTLRTKVLHRINSINTLEMFLKKEIDSTTYYKYLYKREALLKDNW